MRESYIEGKVVLWARQHDILPLKLSARSDSGWPDHFWLFYFPAIAFIEFKAPGGKPRALQLARIAELRRRGYPVEVIDNVERGIEFLTKTLLGTAQVSRASRKTDDNSGVRGPTAGSGPGQDDG
jgi:hypothetical protein